MLDYHGELTPAKWSPMEFRDPEILANESQTSQVDQTREYLFLTSVPKLDGNFTVERSRRI